MDPWKQFQNTRRVITGVVHATSNAKDIYSPAESNARLLYDTTNQIALISQIYSCNETLHVSDSSPVHHQEFFTVHTVIQFCRQLSSSRRIRMEVRSILILLDTCLQNYMTYNIAVCTVKNS
jgi:hypothetical protein